ncbi:hypothetical protein M441DRAFT_259963 [Trichoderma asperellum CBS 433.97]|uniref:Uncharacterized protein n=1 Tax=Trichoderma asperellum (strain ATCC 204424 / CBS 433.97 / NBRC 101777) TaxID=1042311 RepID=A0A2T3YZF9_TRIA4|nr:hypothetical protein M441DRAFT_259963 [Trichoderma asperellum CBS 433.97]PTB37894.1 hypothetical protein M441DRAFT_259963 [Trichoderma asperellum CBS 433.97]
MPPLPPRQSARYARVPCNSRIRELICDFSAHRLPTPPDPSAGPPRSTRALISIAERRHGFVRALALDYAPFGRTLFAHLSFLLVAGRPSSSKHQHPFPPEKNTRCDPANASTKRPNRAV